MHIRLGHLDKIELCRRIHFNHTVAGGFAHDLFVHLAFRRNINNDVPFDFCLTSQAPTFGQPAFVIVALLNGIPVRQRTVHRSHPVFWKFAVGRGYLTFAADTASATHAVQVDPKLAGGR